MKELVDRRKNPQIIIGGNVELLNQALLISWSTGSSAARGSYWKVVRDSQTNEELRLDLRVGDMKSPRAEAAIFAWDFLKPETLLDLKCDLDRLQNKNILVIFVCCNGEYTREALETIKRYTQESGVQRFIITNVEPRKFQGFRELDQRISEALKVKIGQNTLFISRKEVYELFRSKKDQENANSDWEDFLPNQYKKNIAATAAKEALAESSADSKKEGSAPLQIPVVQLVIATTHGFEQSKDEIIGNILWYKYIRQSSKDILALAEAQNKSVKDILDLAERELGVTDHFPHPTFSLPGSTTLNAIEKKLLQAQMVIIDVWSFEDFFSHLDEQTQHNFKALIKTKYVMIGHGRDDRDAAIKLSATLGLQENRRQIQRLKEVESSPVLLLATQKIAAMAQESSGEVELPLIKEQNAGENSLPTVIISVEDFNQAYDPMDDAEKEKIKTELKSKFVIIEAKSEDPAQQLATKLELQSEMTEFRIAFSRYIACCPNRTSEKVGKMNPPVLTAPNEEVERQPDSSLLISRGMFNVRRQKHYEALGGAMMTTSALGGAAFAAAVMKGMVTLTVLTSLTSVGVGVAALLLLALFVWGLQKLMSNTCCGSSKQKDRAVPLMAVN